MRAQKNLIVCALLILTATGLGAQGTATIVRDAMRLAESLRPADAKGDTRIIGQIVDIRQMPVTYAKVQLRNLITGKVQQESSSDANGEYQFTVDDPGTYVVEVVLLDGYIVALSNAATPSPHETLQTVVQLPGRWEFNRLVMPTKVSNFFGMSAATTMTAQTMQMALIQGIQPVDSGEPVSPYNP